MKAIILAGGEGTRLQPISIGIPKPMTRILDKPILEHTLNLLKRYEITDICMTLRFLPKMITDYFGDGANWGVNIDYRVEREPLGTAGGVKACEDFLGGSDFIVVSGDAFMNADLSKLISYFEDKRAEAIIALSRCDNPLEYGLVMTGQDGRVTQFIEKPSRDRVVTDLVNTGIYVLRNSVLTAIPENAQFDFAKDLFPAMLNRSAELYATPLDGSWLDVGSCAAYLQANMDALELAGLTRYIGENVMIEPGAIIGPGSVIGFGSLIRSGVKINRSVIDGAEVGANAELRGAILCRGSKVGADSIMRRGGVIGENAEIGSGCYLADGIRVFPNCIVESGTKVCTHITANGASELRFERGVLSGGKTAEQLLKLGQTLGALFHTVGVAGTATAATDVLAAGVMFSGASVFKLDASNAAIAAFSGKAYKLELTVFVGDKCSTWNNSETLLLLDSRCSTWNNFGSLRFTDSLGQLISREIERKIENCPATMQRNDGSTTEIRGCAELYNAEVGALPPGFTLAPDGLTVILVDETSVEWNHAHLLAALTLAEVMHGLKRVPLPYDAPSICDRLASQNGAVALRLWRDPETAQFMAELPHASDGAHLAKRIAYHAAQHYGSYAALMAKLPPICNESAEVQLNGESPGRIMRLLANDCDPNAMELVAGARFDFGDGFADVAPGIQALKIATEAASIEAAKDLCDNLIAKIKQLSRK